MAQLVVTWSNKALEKFDSKALWYLANCGESFTKSFVADIEENVKAISITPTIGRIRKETSSRTYRIFVNHPKCSIYYWHDNREIRIIDILFSQMRFRP